MSPGRPSPIRLGWAGLTSPLVPLVRRRPSFLCPTMPAPVWAPDPCSLSLPLSLVLTVWTVDREEIRDEGLKGPCSTHSRILHEMLLQYLFYSEIGLVSPTAMSTLHAPTPTLSPTPPHLCGSSWHAMRAGRPSHSATWYLHHAVSTKIVPKFSASTSICATSSSIVLRVRPWSNQTISG